MSKHDKQPASSIGTVRYGTVRACRRVSGSTAGGSLIYNTRWFSRNLARHATKRGQGQATSHPITFACICCNHNKKCMQRSTKYMDPSIGLDQLEQDRDQKVSPLDSNPIDQGGRSSSDFDRSINQSLNQPCNKLANHLCASSMYI